MTLWNPLTWFSNISQTGQFIEPESDPLTNPGVIPQRPVHHMLSGDSQQKYEEKLALINKFITVTDTRSQLLAELRKLRKSPIVQTILNGYINEGFYSNNKQEVYGITYIGKGKKNQINARIKETTDRLNLQNVIASLLPELGTLGEHLLTPILDKENKKKGIIELYDNALLEDILPVYRGQILINFLKKQYDPGNPVKFLDPETYVHFILPNDPIKIRMDYANSGVLQRYNLPEYLKMGRSIFLLAIDAIKRLEMLDTANLALALRQILLPILLGIGVPAGTPMKDVIALTDYYETHLEEIFSDVGNVQNITIQSLLEVSSKIRALPQYSDGKGNLQVLDIGANKTPNFEQTNAIKKEIALITDIPFYFISTDGTEGNTGDYNTKLKAYAKFAKAINNFQFAVKNGVANIYCLDLKYSGFQVKPSELDIDFKQIVNADQLSMLEYLVGSGTALGEIWSSASQIASDEKSGLMVDADVMLQIANTVYDNVPNARGLLKKAPPPEPVEEPAPENPEEIPDTETEPQAEESFETEENLYD